MEGTVGHVDDVEEPGGVGRGGGEGEKREVGGGTKNFFKTEIKNRKKIKT